MNTTDIGLHETGSGGDFSLLNDDLLVSESLYQQIYLALFGGNVEASTKTTYLPTEQRYDYWANSLIWSDAKTRQFNSETERTIKSVALNSSGRVAINAAIERDLEYLKDVISFTVVTSITSLTSVSLSISFTEKGNQESKSMDLVYNNLKNEVIITNII